MGTIARRSWVLPAALALLAGGCFDPDLGAQGGYRCAGPRDCPADQDCVSEVCVPRGQQDLGPGKKDLAKQEDGPGKQDSGKVLDSGKVQDKGNVPDTGKVPDKMVRLDKAVQPDKKLAPDKSPPPDMFQQKDAAPKCGNNYLDSNEECDGTLLGGKKCTDFSNYTGGTLSCYKCKFNTANCTKCGDGKLTGNEPCDGTLFGTKTCKTESKEVYTDGKLTCSSACTAIYTTGCYSLGVVNSVASLFSTTSVEPSLVWFSSNKGGLVVWDDAHSNSWAARDLYAQVLDTSIKPTLSKPSKLTDTYVYHHRGPDIAELGGDHVMVYTDTNTSNGKANVFAALVDTNGKLKSTAGTQLDKQVVEQVEPAIACSKGANTCLAVWADSRKNSSYHYIYGALLTRSGTAVKVSLLFSISDGPYSHATPDVASDGKDYLVVWRYKYSAAIYIQSKWVTGAGVPSKSTSAVSPADLTETAHPRLAYNGTSQYLVMWEDYRNKNWDIYGARVSQTGIVHTTDYKTGGFKVTTSTKNEYAPALDCHNGICLVAYTYPQVSLLNQVHVRRVKFSGLNYTIPDSAGIVVSTAVTSVAAPAVTVDKGQGQFVLAWRKVNSLTGSATLSARSFKP